jgi:hypothetical protein
MEGKRRAGNEQVGDLALRVAALGLKVSGDLTARSLFGLELLLKLNNGRDGGHDK